MTVSCILFDYHDVCEITGNKLFEFYFSVPHLYFCVCWGVVFIFLQERQNQNAYRLNYIFLLSNKNRSLNPLDNF